MMKKSTNQLTQEKLQRLVSLMVERKLVLLEDKKFNAIRSLTIEAQQAAMKFEQSMVDGLELLDPDEMSDHEQQVFAQAMSDFHKEFVSSVVRACETLKTLSGKPVEPSVKQSSVAKPKLHVNLPDLPSGPDGPKGLAV